MNFISKFFKKRELNRKQEEINKLYESEGFNDKILEMQLEVNRLRHELDICDESKIINDEGFVQ